MSHYDKLGQLLTSCHVCNGKAMWFGETDNGVDFFHCSVCDAVFKSPECYQSIAEQKARYDLHNNDENDEGYRAYFQRFLDFVLPQVEDVDTALDFGCGRSTLLANILNSMNIDTDAYDPIYHPDLPYHSKKYDLILSTEVFEHLHDPKAVFASLVECLNGGGYLAIQTQFYPDSIEDFKKWYYHKDPTHIVFFNTTTFRHLAAMHGCIYLADNSRNMVLFKKTGE